MVDRTEKEIISTWNFNKPTISICTISYNQEKYIAEALDSFLMQRTSFPFEIVVDDDASNDKTAEILLEYQKKFPNIMNINFHKKNIGATKNFFQNIQRAKGEYIALCEGDDYWTDCNKLQIQADFLSKHPAYVMSFHNIDMKFEENGRFEKSIIKNGRDFTQSELKCANVYCPTCTVMFKKEGLQIKNTYFTIGGGDILLWHLLGCNGKAKFQSNIGNSVYRQHSAGIYAGLDSIEKYKFFFKNRSFIKKIVHPADTNTIQCLEETLIEHGKKCLDYYVFKNMRSYINCLKLLYKFRILHRAFGRHLVSVFKRILMFFKRKLHEISSS